jgi:outer membrane protein OmpA-like peptidoglycan-associated protein
MIFDSLNNANRYLNAGLRVVLKLVFCVGLSLVIVGCSQLSKYSPSMDWLKISASKIENAIGQITDIGSDNSSASYPKLSSVPVLPETMSSQDERTTIRNRLIADRDSANYVRGKSNLWPNSLPPKMKRINHSSKVDSSKSRITTSNVSKPVFSKLKKELKQERLANNDKFAEQSVAKAKLNKIVNSVSERKSLPKFRFNIQQGTNGQDNLAKGKLKFKFINAAVNQEAQAIFFGHGSSRLSKNDIEIIKNIAEKAITTNAVVHVKGHASMRTRNMDPIQHALANFNISIKRANAVAKALMKNRVPAGRLIIDAVGASEPVSIEAMPSGERANRRAEISLSAT